MNYASSNNYFEADVIAEAQGANILAYYTQGQGLISQRRNNASYFYHYDGLGSTKALTDANQNIQNTTKYDAWGNILQSSGTITNPYLYVGELGYYGDGDAGMYLLTQRWYNPVIGRFVVRDPIEDEPDSLYLYGSQNPVVHVDPNGTWWLIDRVKNICCKIKEKIKEYFKGELVDLTDAITEIFATAMGGNVGAATRLLSQATSCFKIPDAIKTCRDMINDVARKPLKGDMMDQIESCKACCTELAVAMGLVSHAYLAYHACWRACSKAADIAQKQSSKPKPPKPKPPKPNPKG
jgi:RHS repeat-associated protein